MNLLFHQLKENRSLSYSKCAKASLKHVCTALYYCIIRKNKIHEYVAKIMIWYIIYNEILEGGKHARSK